VRRKLLNGRHVVRGDPSKRKLTGEQISALLAEYEAVKASRPGKRNAPNGWRAAKAAELGVSESLIRSVLEGRIAT